MGLLPASPNFQGILFGTYVSVMFSWLFPPPGTAGLTPDDPGKETEHWFKVLHSGNVLANSKPLVRSAIGRIKVRAPDDTKIFFPYYERVKNMKHATDTLVDSGQESDALYAYGSNGEECEVERG